MIATTENLLASTVYGTPSGNYDGTSSFFFGDPVVAANYYGGQGATQTATANISGFSGTITFQATLADQLGQALWFDVDSILGTDTTDVISRTMIGNFCYMRVAVTDFTAGTINSVSLTY